MQIYIFKISQKNFFNEQAIYYNKKGRETGKGAKKKWHLMTAQSNDCLMSGALPFSECNERMPFVAIQRPTGANVILLRQ